MTWQQLRHAWPDQWLLIEALRAHSAGGRRVLDELAALAAFPDSTSALAACARLHRGSPDKELYVFHTSRPSLDIEERPWLGIRAGA